MNGTPVLEKYPFVYAPTSWKPALQRDWPSHAGVVSRDGSVQQRSTGRKHANAAMRIRTGCRGGYTKGNLQCCRRARQSKKTCTRRAQAYGKNAPNSHTDIERPHVLDWARDSEESALLVQNREQTAPCTAW